MMNRAELELLHQTSPIGNYIFLHDHSPSQFFSIFVFDSDVPVKMVLVMVDASVLRAVDIINPVQTDAGFSRGVFVSCDLNSSNRSIMLQTLLKHPCIEQRESVWSALNGFRFCDFGSVRCVS